LTETRVRTIRKVLLILLLMKIMLMGYMHVKK